MNTEATKVRILELSPYEKRKLQNIISGYGKLKLAAEAAGLHVHTIRNVALIGRGEPETIGKIRNYILAA